VIVDGVLNLLYGILSPLVGLLPTGTFPIATNFGQGLKEVIWKVDYLVPFLSPFVWLFSVVALTWSALLAYRVGVFLYNKVRG
jgi:hypothetical protein